ncbi:adenylylsulfate kinase [Paenibacillus cellulosilyticus]|uniref:Adenylyl-sulfate kinase n=1 Tax=Paenibacillus cellulosilyticus TaxID=375489 RepID=A0A2V2YX83_9BACL|nr:adenylyl-sulfate kinase [Paenibacillus cellulosilyticus]PWW04798.1 adenylylsulfate kinase [Paenibacillus cellulosilyticus]QKS45919.1 adenylyl-sulfate kinase [Paenibacillus cellulosilyticus]
MTAPEKGGEVIDRKRLNSSIDCHGGVVWFTGLSGSGKTTVSQLVEQQLIDRGCRCVVIDGDKLRAGLNRDLGFTEEDRAENLRRAAEVAAMFLEVGFIVLVPMITPTEAMREQVRKRFDSETYSEVYVRCSFDTCEQRDPKGLYRKARQGQIRDFTGIDARYEPPIQPELAIDTELQSIEQCAQQLIDFIESKYVTQTEGVDHR